jgi:hypothetical protein
VHAIATTVEVDGGVAGDTPRSAGWSRRATRDWGRGTVRDGDGRDRVGPVDGASRARQVDGAADATAASGQRGETCRYGEFFYF